MVCVHEECKYDSFCLTSTNFLHGSMLTKKQYKKRVREHASVQTRFVKAWVHVKKALKKNSAVSCTYSTQTV